jgi:putative dimethyl sulfoxide reductase chaperone
MSFELQQAVAREDMCRFLAACYYQPGSEFAEERLFDSMLAAAEQLDPTLAELARDLGDAFVGQELEALLVDYARLFLGPGEALARPYGSFWLSGDKTVMQDSTLAVRELFRQGGLDLDESFNEVPDHVAVELELLYRLNFRGNEARQAGKSADVDAVEALERRFLDEHLGAWVGPFTAAVKSSASTVFYRQLAELTVRFVRMREASLRVVN